MKKVALPKLDYATPAARGRGSRSGRNRRSEPWPWYGYVVIGALVVVIVWCVLEIVLIRL